MNLENDTEYVTRDGDSAIINHSDSRELSYRDEAEETKLRR